MTARTSQQCRCWLGAFLHRSRRRPLFHGISCSLLSSTCGRRFGSRAVLLCPWSCRWREMPAAHAWAVSRLATGCPPWGTGTVPERRLANRAWCLNAAIVARVLRSERSRHRRPIFSCFATTLFCSLFLAFGHWRCGDFGGGFTQLLLRWLPSGAFRAWGAVSRCCHGTAPDALLPCLHPRPGDDETCNRPVSLGLGLRLILVFVLSVVTSMLVHANILVRLLGSIVAPNLRLGRS